ncbi:MAG TPA: GAF domain-containing protein [Gemmatimonadales bacterium]|nr:GAF domain-containing protein [Gemmatimonadales bacterium]
MTGSTGDSLARPRLLLTGAAAARPEGLERALTRAGFHIGETPPGPHEPPPDAVLTTLSTADPAQLQQQLANVAAEPPRVILFATDDRDAPAAALALGAADALSAPVHLPELCARLLTRIRERQAPFRTPYEAHVRDSLRDLVDEARSLLQPDEVALALVRRLGRALDLARCSFVVTRPGADEGRVVAELAEDRVEHRRLDLSRYPEIGDAVRSRRPVALPDAEAAGSSGAPPMMVVLPVAVEDEVAGVLLIRGRESAPSLGAAQLGLAGSLAEAAARALDIGRVGGAWRSLSPPTLDRRVQEELERARRYSLSFSLVLLDVGAPADGAGAEPGAGERDRAEIGSRLRRELRLPDFVSGYGGGEFAIVLPETGADGARRSVARLRERLPGVSAGIVAFPHPAVAAPDDMFALVEAALRRGQAQSGERIGIAE